MKLCSLPKHSQQPPLGISRPSGTLCVFVFVLCFEQIHQKLRIFSPIIAALWDFQPSPQVSLCCHSVQFSSWTSAAASHCRKKNPNKQRVADSWKQIEWANCLVFLKASCSASGTDSSPRFVKTLGQVLEPLFPETSILTTWPHPAKQSFMLSLQSITGLNMLCFPDI